MKDFKTHYDNSVVVNSFSKAADVLTQPPYSFTWLYKPGQDTKQNPILGERAALNDEVNSLDPIHAGAKRGPMYTFRILAHYAIEASDIYPSDMLIEIPSPIYIDAHYENLNSGYKYFDQSNIWIRGTTRSQKFDDELEKLRKPYGTIHRYFDTYNYFIQLPKTMDRKEKIIRAYEYMIAHGANEARLGSPGFMERLIKKNLHPDKWSDADLVGQL